MLSQISGMHQSIPDRLEFPELRRNPWLILEHRGERLLPVAAVQYDVIIVREVHVRKGVIRSLDVRIYGVRPLPVLLRPGSHDRRDSARPPIIGGPTQFITD